MCASAGAEGTAGDRVAVIDLWRGFALIGVCVVNFIHTNDDFLSRARAALLPTFDLDWKTSRLVELFLANKSNTIFTLLFGIGMAILIERAERGGLPPERLITRRMLVLFGIGLVHLLLFPGELLHVYGICGILLLTLRRVPSAWLVGVGAALAILPRWIYGEWAFIGAHLPLPHGVALENTTARIGPLTADERYALIHQASVPGLLKANVAFAMESFQEPGRKILQGLYFFGRMLLGFAFWRSGLARRLFAVELRRLLPWLTGLLLAASVLTASMLLDPGENGSGRRFVMAGLRHLQIPALAASYLLGLLVLSKLAFFRPLMGPICAVGRMTLTNYVLQSLAMFFIFYGPGLRLAGDIGPTVTGAIALAIYFAQVGFSVLWLRHAPQGPLEWAWRRIANPPVWKAAQTTA